MLIGALAGAYLLQSLVGHDTVIGRFGFSPAGFLGGERVQLLTALFLHGGLAHLAMNGAFALAFGTPVARYLGAGLAGGLVFFLLYLACGAISSLAYAGLHPDQSVLLIGASGAVSGLFGAASRIVAGRGGLGPFLSAPVIGMGAAWIAVNLLIALVGFAPGAGEAVVAWEAHIAGWAAGLLLIGPAAWALRRP